MFVMAVAAIIVMTRPAGGVVVFASAASSKAISVSIPAVPVPVLSSVTPGLVAFPVAFPIAVTVAVPVFAVAVAVAGKVVAITAVAVCRRMEGRGVVSTRYASVVEAGQ